MIRCLSVGEWNSEFTECKFEPGECPDLPGDGPLTYNCNGASIGMLQSCFAVFVCPASGFFFNCWISLAGAECGVSCSQDYYDPVLRGISKRRMSPTRPRRPLPNDVIETITCTGLLHWHPSPGDLECVQQCSAVGIFGFPPLTILQAICKSGRTLMCMVSPFWCACGFSIPLLVFAA